MQRSYLKKTRIERGLTQQDVAERVGTRAKQITRIELGIRNPSWEVALKLEKLFGIPASELLKRDEE